MLMSYIFGLTHWGQVMHIYIGKLTIIGSDNGLLPWWHHAIIWTSVGILLIGSLGTNFSEILIGIQTFSFKEMHLKLSSAKWWPFRLSLDVLTNGLEILPHVSQTKTDTKQMFERYKDIKPA